MAEGPSHREPPADRELEQEIRQGRKFTAKEAVARLAGPGALKGASPVSAVQQAEMEIGAWLKAHAPDPAGALQVVLHRQLKGSEELLNRLDRPLAVLADHCQCALESGHLLSELVREADVEWGRAMDERPYFERAGSPQHPDDPYSLETVRKALQEAVAKLGGEASK